jgi:arylsulfatase A-like enzyme
MRAGEALAASLLAALLAACGDQRPNIVVLLTDDQRADSLAGMPRVSQLAAQGVRFHAAFVPSPVCAPSRAALLTGRLPSALGIHVNEGAASVFDASDTIAVRLQQQGYTTALYGKYVNGYAAQFPAVPPGWSEWRVLRDGLDDLFGPGSLYRDPLLSWDGEARELKGYTTDLLADSAVDFVTRRAKEDAPFFLLVAFQAPHVPLDPAERHEGKAAERGAVVPPPAIDETDLSDKAAWLAAQAKPPAERRALWQIGEPRTYEVLLGVDEAVGRILDALAAQGADDDTLVVYTSDNGFLFGEHGWFGKGVPYEESIRVPLLMRFPARWKPADVTALVTSLDLAPTFAALGGARSDGYTDGESLLPLLRAPTTAAWRHEIPLEFDARMGMPMGYRGRRGDRDKHITWDDGAQESYDLALDPQELEGRRVPPASAAR